MRAAYLFTHKGMDAFMAGSQQVGKAPSLLFRLDTTIALGLQLVLQALFIVLLWLMALGLLALSLLDIFEYGEGFWDLSHGEILFLGLAALLIKRHWRYCHRFNYRWWSTLHRLMLALGSFCLMILLTLAIPGIVLVSQPSELELLELMTTWPPSKTPQETIVYHLLLLLCLYLAAPARARVCAIKAKSDTAKTPEPAEGSA